METYTITTQRELRRAFWADHPNVKRKPGDQNKQVADTRMAWCDYVEAMRANGQISEALANRATL